MSKCIFRANFENTENEGRLDYLVIIAGDIVTNSIWRKALQMSLDYADKKSDCLVLTGLEFLGYGST